MSWVAVGIVGGSLVSGYLGKEAAGDAADTAADAAGRSQAYIEKAAEQAREDALTYFPQARKDLLAGSGAAFDMFGRGMDMQQQAVTGGNVAAQNTLSQGFGNIQNALLGLPVDQSAFQAYQPAVQPLPTNPMPNVFGESLTGVTPSTATNNIGQNFGRYITSRRRLIR